MPRPGFAHQGGAAAKMAVAASRNAPRTLDGGRALIVPGLPSPVRDSPVRDSAVRDSPVRDSAVRDSPVRDSAVRDSPVRDSAVRDRAVRDERE